MKKAGASSKAADSSAGVRFTEDGEADDAGGDDGNEEEEEDQPVAVARKAADKSKGKGKGKARARDRRSRGHARLPGALSAINIVST